MDVLFNLRALPLQGLSLLVLPVYWTVPRLLAIQLAVPASILEGAVVAAGRWRGRLAAILHGHSALVVLVFGRWADLLLLTSS